MTFCYFPLTYFISLVIYIFNILLLCLVAGLCHQLTNALVERKQVSNVIQVFIVLLQYISNLHSELIVKVLG